MGISFFRPGHHDEGRYHETSQIGLILNNNQRIGYFMQSNYFKFNFQPKEQKISLDKNHF